MSKKSNKKELIIGGVVASLMMGGTAMASLRSAGTENNQFFKLNDLKRGYQLADNHDKQCGEKDKKCGEKDKKCGEKKCGEKDKKCGEKKCGADKACGEKSCG